MGGEESVEIGNKDELQAPGEEVTNAEKDKKKKKKKNKKKKAKDGEGKVEAVKEDD